MKAKGAAPTPPKQTVTKPAAMRRMGQMMNAAVVRGHKAKEVKRK